MSHVPQQAAVQVLERTPIDYWEFGVFKGESLKWWRSNIPHPKSRFVGFDTFTGLPERWRATEPEGAFNVYGRLPDIKDSRCSFESGFSRTRFCLLLPATISPGDW
jgi:hypothetical protein